jgi:hypothetical protein
VVVTFSEPVQRWDGGSLNISDKPGDIFYGWGLDNTGYFLIDSIFVNINNLKRDPGRSKAITFAMSNGKILNGTCFLSIRDSSRKYLTDTTVRAILPNSNNRPKRVILVSLPEQVILISPFDSAKIQADSVRITWKKASPLITPVTRYNVQIATDSAMSFSIQDSAITDTTKLFKPLNNGQTYWWRVRACNAIGWGPYSKKSRFVGANSAVLPKKFEVVSFGCKGSSKVLRYALPSQSYVCLKYYDVRGRMVVSLINQLQKPGYYSLSLPIVTWARGTYIQDFRAGSFIKKERIVVVK